MAGNALSSRLMADVLRDFGYAETLIREEFPIWTDEGVTRADLVAFGRTTPQDMTTATILCGAVGIEQSVEALLSSAVALACPAAIVFTQDDEIQLWSIGISSSSHHRVAASPSGTAVEDLGRFGSALAPDSLLAAKTHSRQLALFPLEVELLTRARQTSSDRLGVRVNEAMDIAIASGRSTQASSERRLADAAQAVVSAMVALVVRDKFGVTEADPDLLLRRASEHFPGYFDERLSGRHDPLTFGHLLSVLGDGVNFEGLDAAVMSDVYESALVSEADRLKLGIYYTPPWLAREVVKRVPFEAIAPEDRVVLDPACGSGTFLLAAHDRLAEMTPWSWTLDAQHEYVKNHIVGIDQDQFAVEVAKLSLLLHAMPAGNSWRVERRNTLTKGVPDDVRPAVIVSNPPWKGVRSVGGHRHEVADEFVRKCLATVRPGGYVAMVLPAAWLDGKTSRDTRALLIDSTEILEVWRLTEEVFGASAKAPCVVIAHSTRPLGRSFLYRRVLNRTESMRTFRENGHSDQLALVMPPRDGNRRALLPKPADLLPELAGLAPLSTVAQIKAAPVPEPPIHERGLSGGEFLWLRRGVDLPAFAEPAESALTRVRYPEEFHRAAVDDSWLPQRKLLISAKRSAENPWRLKVGLDLRGIIPRETLQMVLPLSGSDDDLYALMAVLGSSLGSYWVDASSPKIVITADDIGTIPVPATKGAWQALSKLGRRLAQKVGTQQQASVVDALEEGVAKAYNLSVPARLMLAKHFAGFMAPEGEVRYPTVAADPGRPTSGERHIGAVLGVRDQELLLWIPGLTHDDGEWRPLPRGINGWMCEAGATFELVGPLDDLDACRFEFQAGSYLDEIEDLVPSTQGERQSAR
jgi:SAM-dependent methyltransferase